jgi:hypothetical protein
MGERGKQTNALVATRIRRVAPIAAWATRKPSDITSGAITPSKPIASARAAMAGISASGA